WASSHLLRRQLTYSFTQIEPRKSPPFEGGQAAPKAQTGVVSLTTPPARKARRHPSFKRRGFFGFPIRSHLHTPPLQLFIPYTVSGDPHLLLLRRPARDSISAGFAGVCSS